jgi:hypothetical protein
MLGRVLPLIVVSLDFFSDSGLVNCETEVKVVEGGAE